MKVNLNISQKGVLLVSVPLVCELLFAGVLVFLLNQAEAEINRAVKAKTIIQHANVVVVQVMRVMGSLQRAKRNLINQSSTESDEWKNDYVMARRGADNEFSQLEQLVSDRPMQAVLLKKIKDKAHACYAVIEKLADIEDHDPSLEHKIALFGAKQRLNEYFYQILADLDEFSSNERRVESESPVIQTAYRRNVQYALVAGIVLNVVFAVGLALYFSRGIASRLMVINQNSRNMAEGKPLSRPLEGNDEIANVDRVFHSMATRLKELDDLKRDFVAMVSHDLRTPLTSLQAFLTLLEEGVLDENVSEKTKVRARGAEEDVARLIRLINELLDIEKMERGSIELKIDSMAVADLLERSVESVKASADQKKIVISVNACEQRIVADRDRLIQVVVNILSNAIKFSPLGSSIEIDVQPIADQIEFRFTDHGRGIPPHLKEAIFDRFRQVELADEREKGGSGLGLAISKSIIEQHGGTLGVESEVGRGSTFWFRIPKEVSLF